MPTYTLQPVCKSDSTSIVTPTLFSRSIGGGSTNSLFKIYCEPGDGPIVNVIPNPAFDGSMDLSDEDEDPPRSICGRQGSSASQESNFDQPTPLPVAAPQEHETVHECEALFY